MDLELRGKVAFITGGSGAIGAAAAHVLAEEGANVAVGYHRGRDRALDVVSQLRDVGVSAEAVQVDVRDSRSVRDAFARAVSALGGIDHLVNCAGVASFAPLAEHEEAEWDRIFDTNVKGAYLCSQEALKYLPADGGSIVNVSSLAASTGSFEGPAYAASKAAMNSLTLSLSLELASRGIRVNAIAPGRIDTPFRRTRSGAYFDFMLRQTPLARMGTAREVANGIAFLASPMSAFTTATVLYVTGGLHSVHLEHVIPEPGAALGS